MNLTRLLFGMPPLPKGRGNKTRYSIILVPTLCVETHTGLYATQAHRRHANAQTIPCRKLAAMSQRRKMIKPFYRTPKPVCIPTPERGNECEYIGCAESMPGKQQGMTLLELTVVLLILVTLSTIALRSTTGLQDQARWEQTKKRYEAIKKAIFGDPTITINGHPDISGFISDTGRLPACIQELLIEGYCPKNTFCNQTDCNNDTPGSWVSTGYNWNGPYLTSSEPATDTDAFSDGWGNTGAGNYGWSVAFDSPATTSATSISIKSLGKDQTAGGAVSYDIDYPSSAATLSDWKTNLSSGINLITQLPFNGSCSVTYNSANSCEIAGGVWHGSCDLSYSSRYPCTLNGGIWTDAEGCSNPAYTNQTDCETNSEKWGQCTGANTTPDSKLFCESIGGSWSFNTVDVALEITYQDGLGLGGTTTSFATATVEENGSEQIISFSGFSQTSITMGINSVFMQVNGTNNIYPPSCSGLNGDAGVNGYSDCVDAGGTLYPNGLCGDITPVECTTGADGSTGTLIRKSVDLPFIPNKAVSVINW